jgi:hypothetical protein
MFYVIIHERKDIISFHIHTQQQQQPFHANNKGNLNES